MTRPILLLAATTLLSVTSCKDEAPPTSPLEEAPAAEPAEAAPPKEVTPTAEAPPTQAPTGPKETTFDLLANRHLAHLWSGGLVIDVGHASALKYVQGRWNTNWLGSVEVDGQRAGYPKGPAGTLRFPLWSPSKDKSAWKVSARLRPVGDQAADLFLKAANGEEAKVGSFGAIESDWGTYELALPTDVAAGQEHALRLHFSKSRAVEGGKSAALIDWVVIGPAPPKEIPRRDVVFDTRGNRVRLGAGEAVWWDTMIAPGSWFVAGIDGEAELRVWEEGKAEPVVFKAEEGKFHADLSPHAGRPIRLALVASSDATFTRPRIDVAKQEATPRGKAPKYVVVWIADTLRADHTRVYNPKSDVETDALQELAKQSALFKRATVQGNSSLPSSASIFTGAYPPLHALVVDDAKLKEEQMLLAEPFQSSEFATGLFSSNGYVSDAWGFSRGFDKVVNPVREERPADTEFLWPEAEAWLKEAGAPAFLYVNTVDPHVPYDPPAPLLAKYHKGASIGQVSPRATGELLHQLAKGETKLNDDEAKFLHALYKGEVTYNDMWLGSALEALEQAGIRDQTLLVLTADHGEEFGEYGRFGHGVSVNQELVDVPLLIHYRPWTQAGLVIEENVELVDLFDTLLDAAKLGEFEGDSSQGISLVDLLLDPTARHPRPAFAYHNDFLRSARVGDWKYQLFNGDKDPLYMLSQPEPGAAWDADDVSDAHPFARRMMRDLMAFQVGLDKEWRKREHGFTNNHSDDAARWLDKRGW